MLKNRNIHRFGSIFSHPLEQSSGAFTWNSPAPFDYSRNLMGLIRHLLQQTILGPNYGGGKFKPGCKTQILNYVADLALDDWGILGRWWGGGSKIDLARFSCAYYNPNFTIQQTISHCWRWFLQQIQNLNLLRATILIILMLKQLFLYRAINANIPYVQNMQIYVIFSY